MDSSNKKRRGTIKYYLFYVDRQEDEIEVLDRLGLMHNAVIPLNVYAWDYLQKIYVLTPEIYRSLR